MTFLLSLTAVRRHSWVGFLLLVFTLVASNGFAQLVHVESKVKVSPANGGWYPWYEIAADPTNSDNLIVCGSRWHSGDNAFYGFVYSSSDGGKTWRIALEDKSSTWVSEHSCAFGTNGKAYFVSEAATVNAGAPKDLSKGTTRIFASNDAGRTWVEATRTGWADYSTSVVDTRPGPNQNRLYTFFNYVDFNAPDSAKDRAEGNGSRVSVIAFKGGEQQPETPIINPKMGALKYLGSYPDKAFLLRDGSLLALYIAPVKTERGLVDIIGAVRMGKDHLSLSDAVTVARVPISERSCHPADFATAYDPLHDVLYLAYHAPEGGKCRFILKTSLDDGTTWSEGNDIPRPETISHGLFSPAMAFDHNGTLGLMWRDERVSDCWYFSASLDKGKSFTRAQSLSQCSDKPTLPLLDSDASLRMASSVSDPSDPSKPGSSPGHHVLDLQIVDSRNCVWRNTGALAVTSDGVFHPVWIEVGHGEGELRTASVMVGAVRDKALLTFPAKEKDAQDVSEDVAVIYGGDQHYDISSGTLTVGVVLKNRSNEPIRAPLILKALTLSTELEKLEIGNASNGVLGPGAIWDLSKTVPNGVLGAGATTTPYSLVFRVPQNAAPPTELEIVSMQLEVLSAVPAPPRTSP